MAVRDPIEKRLLKYIANQLNEILESYGWSQRRLARECELPVMTVNNICTQRAMPSVSLLLRICEVFGLKIADFLPDEPTFHSNAAVTAEEISKQFNISIATIQSWVMQGLLAPSMKGEDPPTFFPSEVRKLIEERDAESA